MATGNWVGLSGLLFLSNLFLSSPLTNFVAGPLECLLAPLAKKGKSEGKRGKKRKGMGEKGKKKKEGENRKKKPTKTREVLVLDGGLSPSPPPFDLDDPKWANAERGKRNDRAHVADGPALEGIGGESGGRRCRVHVFWPFN